MKRWEQINKILGQDKALATQAYEIYDLLTDKESKELFEALIECLDEEVDNEK